MLQIKNLKVKQENSKEFIIDGLDLQLNKGEIHLLLGPNGAGKSTLAKSILNWPGYTISGEISMDEEDLSKIELSMRARKGIFLAHQSPVEIPGVHLVEFIRTAYNNMRKEDQHIDPWSFKDMFEAVAHSLGMSTTFSERNLNEGFSGGEKRKNEVLQMLLLQPKYAILDEIDSGLDIDSLKLVFNAINEFVKESEAGVLVISHNPKILDYIKPEKVHLMKNKKIVRTGDFSLAEKIINEGYATYESE